MSQYQNYYRGSLVVVILKLCLSVWSEDVVVDVDVDVDACCLVRDDHPLIWGVSNSLDHGRIRKDFRGFTRRMKTVNSCRSKHPCFTPKKLSVANASLSVFPQRRRDTFWKDKMFCIVLSWLQALAECYRDLGIKTEICMTGFECAEEGRAHPMLSHDRKCVFCGGRLKALMVLMFMNDCWESMFWSIIFDYMWDFDIRVYIAASSS